MKVYALSNAKILNCLHRESPHYDVLRSFLNTKLRLSYDVVLLGETEVLKDSINNLEQFELPYEFPDEIQQAHVIRLRCADRKPANLLLPLNTQAVTWAYEAFLSRTSDNTTSWIPVAEKKINDYLRSVGFLPKEKASFQTNWLSDILYFYSGVSGSRLLELDITKQQFPIYRYPLDFL